MRVVGPTLCVVGIVLSLQDGIDPTGVIVVGKLVSLVGVVVLLLYAVFNVVGDSTD